MRAAVQRGRPGWSLPRFLPQTTRTVREEQPAAAACEHARETRQAHGNRREVHPACRLSAADTDGFSMLLGTPGKHLATRL